MEKFDVLIIGAGVVGLACAREISNEGLSVVVAEKNSSFGEETSSRNSEIIHAGLYYKPGSLKAKLCIEGRRRLVELCREHGIPFKLTGKIIVSITEAETGQLEALKRNAEECGADTLTMLTGKEVAAMEPAVTASSGLLSPGTGIIDTHSLMAFFLRSAEENGAIVVFDSPVEEITPEDGLYRIALGDRDATRFASRVVVNAAGLNADGVAEMAGIDTDKHGYRLHLAKGEYFRVGGKSPVSRLIYPVPKSGGGHLGIHTVIDLAGSLKLGPNEYYVTEIEYSVNPDNLAPTYDSVRKFIPGLEISGLSPDMSGIRPRLYLKGEEVRDFVICDERDKGLPGFINLIGIESPGLTAAPAIARHVSSLVKPYL
ncbi:MAG: NAD(P)/FAD-dependent oxidoreductase [Candidatus Tritonobacter lacicola]|nr:NAD(P)/FAD-dependent oxidoreductase [Candidatus Tritonobacter lacicola]